jgi:hypothetical protein
MDLAGWRDLSLIVIGFFYAIGTLVVGVVAFLLWIYSRRGLGFVDRFITDQARPFLDRVELQLIDLRERSTALPGNASLGAGDPRVKQARGRSLPFPIPFRRKRRIPFLPF